MSEAPIKQRTLPRTRSSPSLNVGLPPTVPRTSIMSSPSKAFQRSQPRMRVHRGDVESSISGSSVTSEDEEDRLPTTPGAPIPISTPVKRRVIHTDDTLTPTKVSGKKRDNLAARLAQAAQIKKSRSIGEGLNDSPAVPPLPSMYRAPTSHAPAMTPTKPTLPTSTSSAGAGSDKVVVCVRSVVISISRDCRRQAYKLDKLTRAGSNQLLQNSQRWHTT
jgi:hypothetical protein